MVMMYYLNDNYPSRLTREAWEKLQDVMEGVYSDLFGFGDYMAKNDLTRVIENTTLIHNLLYTYIKYELRFVEDLLCSKCGNHEQNPSFFKNKMSKVLKKDGHSVQCIANNVADQIKYADIIKQNINEWEINPILTSFYIGTLGDVDFKKILERISSTDIVKKPCYYGISELLVQKYSAYHRYKYLYNYYGIQ